MDEDLKHQAHKKAEHLIEVWLHELQDHANLVATMPAESGADKLRNAYYEGFALGCNNDVPWLQEKMRYIRDDSEGDQTDHGLASAGVMGFVDARKFNERLNKEDRDVYRQKMYDKVKGQLTKITPWADQTRKPL
jgi:hypothetical protein